MKQRSKKTGKKTGEVRPGPKGGMLKSGNPGNAGGTGRPTSAFREACREAFDRNDLLGRMVDIASNSPDEKAAIAAAKLLAEWGHPELKKVEVAGEAGGPIQIRVTYDRNLTAGAA